MGNVKASEIASFLGAELIGDDILISKAVSFDNIEMNSMVFIKYADFKENIDIKSLYLVIEDKNILDSSLASYIRVENPRLSFAKIIEKFFIESFSSKIEKSANIEDSAKIGNNVYIGHGCYIGNDVIIGDDTVIKHNVVINSDVVLGTNCLIKSGVVLGEDGFGFDFDKDGTPVKIPHIGKLIIGNSVEIGSNTVIAKGTLNNTIIKDNVKIDALVHIAHNCSIDDNSMIIALSQISGSVKIGKSCWIAPSATIIQKKEIKDNVKVGIGSVVIQNIEENKTVMGLDSIDVIDLFRFKKKNKFGVK
jgi:UDP-3-O-[3-hydroxymyristoyl] glucosamine N-acyltransferase LpxD